MYSLHFGRINRIAAIDNSQWAEFFRRGIGSEVERFSHPSSPMPRNNPR
jgi:hypothetical protein